MTGDRRLVADGSKQGDGLRSDSRGQTLNDLVIGIGLFLIAATFILAFVPDLVAPFYEPGDRGEKIKAERSADLLSEHLLQHEDYRGTAPVLERECVDEFFAQNSSPDCPYGGGEYKEELRLDDLSDVKVTLEAQGGPVYDTVETADPSGKTPAVWSRLVWMAGDRYRLTVYVW